MSDDELHIARRDGDPDPGSNAPVASGHAEPRPASGQAHQLLQASVRSRLFGAPKHRVLGRFEIERHLGEGAMGVVYEATDLVRGERVALKTLTKVDGTGVYRLKHEFRVLADVVHPHLISLHELFSDGQMWFFTMQLVDGHDFLAYVRPTESSELSSAHLSRIAQSSAVATSTIEFAAPWPASPADAPSVPAERVAPAFDESRVRSTLAQLADAVSFLHSRGKVHRDLKPSNVMVTHDHRVVVLDFGISQDLPRDRTMHGLTQTSSIGTPAFMAPEQAAGERAAPASDWYAVGTMLYCALTGRLPFDGNLTSVLVRKQTDDPLPPSAFVHDLPADLEQLCMRLLARDATQRPSGDVIARMLGVRSPTSSPSPASALTVPFVGRERELASLASAFARVRRGQPTIAFVAGESGVGKSELVLRFLASLPEHDSLVLAGRCYERESVPYKGFDAAIDALSAYLQSLPEEEVRALLPRDTAALSQVFPVLGRVDAVNQARSTLETIVPEPRELRRRTFEALRELLRRLALARPLVVYIDDLQWGDLESAELLNELTGRADAPPLLFIGSYRSDEVAGSPMLETLLASQRSASTADGRVTNIALGPLTLDDAQRCAVAILPRHDRATLARVVEESGQIPFFVVTLARQLAHGGRLSSLADAVREHIFGLPASARRLLEVVAVAGRSIELDTALQAASVGHETVSHLRVENLVRTRGAGEHDVIETYHDRIREAVLAGLDRETARRHHERLAAALEHAAGTDPERLYTHYLEAQDTERAGCYAVLAGHAAARALAFARAARLYQAALELRPGDDARNHELSLALADALTHAGRGAEAAPLYLHCAQRATPAHALELRRRAAEQWMITGHIDQGLQAIATVMQAVGIAMPDNPRGVIADLLWNRAARWLSGLHYTPREAHDVPTQELLRIDACKAVSWPLSYIDPIRGAAFQARNTRLALRAGERKRITEALAVDATFLSLEGTPTQHRVAQLLAAAQRASEGIDDPHTQAMLPWGRGMSGFLLGRFEQALTELQRAESILVEQCSGVTFELSVVRTFLLGSLVALGRWREHGPKARAWLEDAYERGDLYASTNYRVVWGGNLWWLAHDDPRGAAQDLDEAMQRWPLKVLDSQRFEAIWSETKIALYENDAERATRCTVNLWPRFRGSALRRVQLGRIRARTTIAAAALLRAAESSHRRSHLRMARQQSRALEREQVAWARAHAHAIEAAIAHLTGDPATAVVELCEAANRFDHVGMRLEAASANRHLAGLLGGDDGHTQQRLIDTGMQAQGVRNPERMAATLVPGFP